MITEEQMEALVLDEFSKRPARESFFDFLMRVAQKARILATDEELRALKSQQDAAIPFRPHHEILDALKTDPKLLADIEQAVAVSKQSLAQLERERTVTREQLNTPLDAARAIESQRGDGS